MIILVLLLAVIVLPALLGSFLTPTQESDNKRTNIHREKLDYSKPVFTTERAIICPQGLLISSLLDKRSGHGINEVFDLWTTILHRSDRVKELGCEEWKEGIRVYAQPMEKFEPFIGIGLSPDGMREFFTMELGLINRSELIHDSAQSTSNDARNNLSPLVNVEAKFINLEPFVVELQRDQGAQTLQIAIALKIFDPALEEQISANLPIIRSRLLSLLSDKHASELVTMEGKMNLAKEINTEANSVLGITSTKNTAPAFDTQKQGIVEVLFTSFLIR
jgi:flagellar basal body-associated protein FliL